MLIWAKGSGASLSNHGSGNRGSSMLTLVDICNIPTTVLTSINACNGDSAQVFGVFRNSAGVYFDTVTTATGCDSVLSQELVLNTIDTSVTTISNGLMANHTGANATYTWIDCTTNLPVPCLLYTSPSPRD